MPYDSTNDTKEHIKAVRGFLGDVVGDLSARSLIHDGSKLEEPEKSMYDKFTPKLRAMTYGSDEYKDCLKQMGPALKHHYEANSHHPEHYANGVNGMSLLDVMEMLADWKAAGMRHADGSIVQSLEINRKRFDISDQLYEILQNTVKELGW
jgi:hypothetical protein